ncbi:LOW QUALITY PROTEIN: hypothetical protein QYF61_001444 [Mycteria americana]|uniref:ribonuclease H n=1 Tax=Mycteria americana TaxID=33587 RepID=A0AAN7SGD7_MYCAM|nr:LOW QUALITY PROTEIN: hypothetical protein QYF61_001444 [Mycteria americana]
MVAEVASQLREDKESLSSSLVSAVEKLSQKVQQLEEDRSYSPPIQTSISAIRSQHSPARERAYRGYTPWATLWFYLCDHREDMRKWDGKSTSTLEARYTWNRLHQEWKHGPTICHGLIQTALEQGEAPEHLQYIDDIIVWGNTAEEVFEKGKKIVQNLLKAGFAIKQSKVKGSAQEIQFLGIKWQDGCRQIPMDVINKITAMSPPTSKKETQAFLGVVGFWRMHIPNYSPTVSPLYQVTRKKNDFKWGPEQRQAFEQIKQEIVHAVGLGPVQAGQEPGRMALPGASGRKHQGRLEVDPWGFGVGDTEDPRPPILQVKKRYWQHVKGFELLHKWLVLKHISSWHSDCWCWAGCSKAGSPLHLMQLMLRGISPDEEVTHAEEGPLYNKLPENEKQYALFTDGSCHIESIGGGKLLYGVLYDELQKLLKEKVNQVRLQR